MGYVDGLHPIAFRGGMGAIPQPEPPEMTSHADYVMQNFYDESLRRLTAQHESNFRLATRQFLFSGVEVSLDRRVDAAYATEFSVRWRLPHGNTLRYSSQISQEIFEQGQDPLARVIIEMTRMAAQELTQLFLRESLREDALRGYTTSYLIEGLETAMQTAVGRMLHQPILYGVSPSQQAMDAQIRLKQRLTEQSINPPMLISIDPGEVNYVIHMGASRMESVFLTNGIDNVQHFETTRLKPLKQYKPTKFKLSDAPIIKEVMPGLMQVPKEDINERVLQIMGEKK